MPLERTSSNLHHQAALIRSNSHKYELSVPPQVAQDSDGTAGSEKAAAAPAEPMQSDADSLRIQEPPENKRLSAVTDNSNDSKRHSQGSTSSAKSRKFKTHVGPWQLGKSLGHGMSGTVRKARHIETGQVAAVKIIILKLAAMSQTASIIDMERAMKKATGSRQDSIPLSLQREITVLKAIEHPNIVKLYDIWENRGQVFMFMEYIEGGELFGYLKSGRIHEDECARLFRQIISGLQYCHRYRLCHRDLKPENILLDYNGNVKLADFGMAAMQGKQNLTTPCGSPHYAAPEVCSGREYLGDKADIWSSGVVLYVMLFSELPFGSNCGADDLQVIINEVCHKPITFPMNSEVSTKARSFLSCILRRKQKERMSIADMWKHEWLAYYDDIAALPENRARWLGGPLPPLSQSDFGKPLKDVSEIDRSIIRSLCVLFQIPDERRFVKLLLDPKANYEKVLYNCIRTFQVAQQENYIAPGLPSSASDYHYAAAAALKKSTTKISMLGGGPPRALSKLQIVPPTGRRPSTRSYRSHGSQRTGSIAGTEISYDPYRSSKPQVPYSGQPYVKVDVVRGHSVASKSQSTGARSSVVGHPVSSVWESTVCSTMSEMPSSPPPLPRDDQGRVRTIRHTSQVKRSFSINSIASSASQNTFGQRQFQRSASHKRLVSFKRAKLQPPRPVNPTSLNARQEFIASSSGNERDTPEHHSLPELQARQDMQASMEADSDTLRKTSKTAFGPDNAREICPIPNGLVNVIPSELSACELSAFCDQAFGPSPVPMSSDDAASMSPNEILAARLDSYRKTGSLTQHIQRPLPEPPIRVPYALQQQRQMAELLRLMKEKEKELGSGLLNDAMTQVEKMMRENAPRITEENTARRIASAPHADKKPLSDVSEQGEAAITADKQNRRYFSDPLPRGLYDNPNVLYDGPTIRFVPQSPASPMVLNEDGFDKGVASASHGRTTEPRVIPIRQESREFSHTFTGDIPRATVALNIRDSLHDSRLHTIEEDHQEAEEAHGSKRNSGTGRIKTWLTGSRSARSSRSSDKQADSPQVKRRPSIELFDAAAAARIATTQRLSGLMNSSERLPITSQFNQASTVRAKQSDSRVSSEFPIRTAAMAETSSKPPLARGIWNWLRGRLRREMALVNHSDDTSVADKSVDSDEKLQYTRPLRSRDCVAGNEPFPQLQPGYQGVNWLSRILHVKAASKMLAFNLPRSRTLKTIRGIFDAWRVHGVKDIVVDKSGGRIWARLDQRNSMGVKPLEIIVVLYTFVYRESQNAGGVTVARFQQTKGAKTSFDRCVEEVDRICWDRGLMVSERKMARDMKKACNAYRRGDSSVL